MWFSNPTQWKNFLNEISPVSTPFSPFPNFALFWSSLIFFTVPVSFYSITVYPRSQWFNKVSYFLFMICKSGGGQLTQAGLGWSQLCSFIHLWSNWEPCSRLGLMGSLSWAISNSHDSHPRMSVLVPTYLCNLSNRSTRVQETHKTSQDLGQELVHSYLLFILLAQSNHVLDSRVRVGEYCKVKWQKWGIRGIPASNQ